MSTWNQLIEAEAASTVLTPQQRARVRQLARRERTASRRAARQRKQFEQRSR